MNFINIHGQAISIGSRTSHVPPPRSKRNADAEKRHMGWAVTGFSPEHLAEAKRVHEEAQKDDETLKPWDEAAYMNGHRPQKARSKPYLIPGAAGECAEMLKRAGWVRVQVEELIR